MKRIIVVAMLLVSIVSASAQSGKAIYQKYSDAPGVSAVFISQAMFRMIGKIPDIDAGAGDVNLAPIIQTLSGLYIIDSENPDVNADMEADMDRLLASGMYELLMEAKDGGETVRMYTAGSDAVVTSFLMLSISDMECTYICLDGKMNRSDLEGILANEMGK